MIESVGTIVIKTSPEEVFRFLANREHFADWTRTATGVRVVISSEGPFADGTLIQHTQVVSRVSHLQVNRGFETDTIRIGFPSSLLVKHMHDRFAVEPAGQATRVTLNVQVEPTPLLKPFAHLVAKRGRQHAQALLEYLRTVLETERSDAAE